MLFQLVVYVLVPLSFVLFFWVKRKLNVLQQKGIPCIEPSFPLGNMSGIGSTVHITTRIKEIYDKFKHEHKVAGFYSMLKPTLITIDLDLIKNILIKDFNNFTDRGVYYNEDADPVSAHMFSLDGEPWRFVRNKLSPTFTSGKIKHMFQTVVETSNEMVATIDSGEDFETRDLCNRFICDVIGRVTFGLECQSLKNKDSELLKTGAGVFKLKGLDMLRFLFCNSFIDLSRKLNLRLMSAASTDYFIGAIRQAVDDREKNNIKRQDFLNSLIQLKNTGTLDGESVDNDKKLTFNQIVAQAFVFFLAGFETSSTNMSLALMELALNPDAQNKLRAEVNEVLEKHNGQIDYESTLGMTYLNQVMNETLRKHAPVGTLMRSAKEDYKIPNTQHTIEKGTQVWIPVYSIHNDEDIYPNPDRFDPDRFSPDEVLKRHNCAFIPFGDGPRNCIGMRFAQLQVKYGIAKIVSEYELKLQSKMKNPPQLNTAAMGMEIDGGIWLQMTKIVK